MVYKRKTSPFAARHGLELDPNSIPHVILAFAAYLVSTPVKYTTHRHYALEYHPPEGRRESTDGVKRGGDNNAA